MDFALIIGGVMVFMAYSIALVLLGMGITNKYNKIAWDKFYEGRDGKRRKDGAGAL